MSTQAIAHGRNNLLDIAPDQLKTARLNKARKQRKSVANTAHLPWHTVALQQSIAASNNLGVIKRPPTYVWLLTAAALVLHVGFAWYLSTHTGERIAKPKPTELALQFERPKPPPQVEPPKLEPKREQPKQAQVLPPIQTAAPEPSNEPAAPSAEPPVAVAPIVTAPPEPPAKPISTVVSKADYLNNPRGPYPPMALRQGLQGTVVVLAHISAEGKVLSAEIKKSSGFKILDNDALNVIKSSWSFTPLKRGDTPVEADVTVPYEYIIE